MEMDLIPKFLKNFSKNKGKENHKNIKMIRKYNFLQHKFKRLDMKLIIRDRSSKNKSKKSKNRQIQPKVKK